MYRLSSQIRPKSRFTEIIHDPSIRVRWRHVGDVWEVTVTAASVAVRYGRLGTRGQTQTKSLTNAGAAERHAERLIAEKTGKGYQEMAAF